MNKLKQIWHGLVEKHKIRKARAILESQGICPDHHVEMFISVTEKNGSITFAHYECHLCNLESSLKKEHARQKKLKNAAAIIGFDLNHVLSSDKAKNIVEEVTSVEKK